MLEAASPGHIAMMIDHEANERGDVEALTRTVVPATPDPMGH
jgi:hypothetical protein